MKNFRQNINSVFLSMAFLIVSAFAFVPQQSYATSMTDYLENQIGDVFLRGFAFSETTPANWYVALYTTACSDSAAGTEVTGGSYARVALPRAATTFKGTHGTTTGASSGTSGTFNNAIVVSFPEATADWGTVTHWGLIDASTGGNPVLCSALTASRNITTGSTPSYAIDALTIQVDN